jgi:hypothetical protein
MNRIVAVLPEIGAGFVGEQVFRWQGHGMRNLDQVSVWPSVEGFNRTGNDIR